jgi:transcriptional regulator with XRE-family HTH domain
MSRQRKRRENQHQELGNRIRLARLAKGWSRIVLLEELANENEINGITYTGHSYSYSTMKNWELGRFQPQPPALRHLARVLAVTVEWLLTGNGEHDENP